MSDSEQVFLLRRLVWKCKWTVIVLSILCVIPLNVVKADMKSYGTKDNQCPVECGCLGNVVDCSSLQLIGAPSGLPPWTEILWVNTPSLSYQQLISWQYLFVFHTSFASISFNTFLRISISKRISVALFFSKRQLVLNKFTFIFMIYSSNVLWSCNVTLNRVIVQAEKFQVESYAYLM